MSPAGLGDKAPTAEPRIPAGRDAALQPGLTTQKRQRLKELEPENRELKRSREILKPPSASFAAAELDRRAK